jgi:hypothetical protein
MIGTIRKHSKWLWWVIASLTIISFVIGYSFMGTNNSRNGGAGGTGSFGTMYGRKITQQDFLNARSEFYLFYYFRNHEWPDRNPNIKDQDLQEQIYLRMMLAQKAQALGIYVTGTAAAKAASELLRSLARDGQSVSVQAFAKQVLEPKGLTTDDFERFVRNDVAVQQMIQTLGLTGALITPQEALAAYQNEHQELSAQIVFFSASNYLSQVAVTPAGVAQFYTNYLAQYRLPERVQVNYVEFNLSNYLAQSKAEWAKTNLEEYVNSEFAQYGTNAFPDAKTPDETKARIRDLLIQQRALADAKAQANDFATAVFSVNQADNLAKVAKQQGLTVHLTAPFASHQYYGSDEFVPSDAFTKAAFGLTAEDPLAGPVAGTYAYYVIALAKQLPSEIPPLDQIRDRVTQDYRLMYATDLAQRAGTNFAPALAGQLAAGHSFTSVCIAAGLQPVALPQFSMSTEALPVLGNRAGLPQVKQALFTTPTGHASSFEGTEDGGFIVYVQSRTPADPKTVSAEMPQFTDGLRRQRESDAFNQWIQAEANRQFRTVSFFAQQAAGAK